MTVVSSHRSDFALDRAMGLCTGLSSVRKFGHNDAVGTAKEDIWTPGGLYTGHITTADFVRIKAGGDAADTAAGLGAQKIRVFGLAEDSWTMLEADLVTNGISASASTLVKFIRVFRLKVLEVGQYGRANEDDINVETNGGIVMAAIQADEGQSQMAIYTIPAGKTGYIRPARFWIDTNQRSSVWIYRRNNANDNTTPFTSVKQVVSHLVGLVGEVDEDYSYTEPLLQRTDIWVAGAANTGSSAIAAQLDIILRDNSLAEST